MIAEYPVGANLPAWKVYRKLNGSWQDWSAATFSCKIYPAGTYTTAATPLLTKTTGITGAVGTDPKAAVPVASATVAWTTGEMATLSTNGLGAYDVILNITVSSNVDAVRDTLRIVP
jgi:hypothetical protein